MIKIMYEDDSILVVEKPAGMESQSSRGFAADMVSELKKYLSTNESTKRTGVRGKTGKQVGSPYVGVIHRLDKPVSGVMVYAKTQAAANALSEQVRSHQMEKIYHAVVCGKFVDNVGNFVDTLLKDGKTNRSRVVDKDEKGGKRAELDYRLLSRGILDGQPVSLAEIHLKTGRHHQIRVQFASRGFPLWGDEKYGDGQEKGREEAAGEPSPVLPSRRGRRGPQETLALYAYRLEFDHPVTGKRLKFEKKPEEGAFLRYEERERISSN